MWTIDTWLDDQPNHKAISSVQLTQISNSSIDCFLLEFKPRPQTPARWWIENWLRPARKPIDLGTLCPPSSPLAPPLSLVPPLIVAEQAGVSAWRCLGAIAPTPSLHSHGFSLLGVLSSFKQSLKFIFNLEGSQRKI